MRGNDPAHWAHHVLKSGPELLTMINWIVADPLDLPA